jgi:hypothetical protein
VEGIDKMCEGLFPEHLTPELFVENVDRMLDKIITLKDFFKLYTALSVQPGVTQKLGPLADANRAFHSMIELYKDYFGQDATKELLLMSAVSKGYAILTLFGDRQKTLSIDLLKEAVMSFVRQKFNISK